MNSLSDSYVLSYLINYVYVTKQIASEGGEGGGLLTISTHLLKLRFLYVPVTPRCTQ